MRCWRCSGTRRPEVRVDELLAGFSRDIGDYDQLTTSGAGTTTTLVCSGLGRYDGGSLVDWWVRVTSGAERDGMRRVTGFSGTTLTVAPAFDSAIGAGVVFELHRYDPMLKLECLGVGALQASDAVLVPFTDETILTQPGATEYVLPERMVGPPVAVRMENRRASPGMMRMTNPGFELGTEGWASAGAVTMETVLRHEAPYQVREGDRSLRVLTEAAGSRVYQDVTEPERFQGGQLTFWVDVYCLAAGRVRAFVQDEGGQGVSDYHPGTGWATLQVSHRVVDRALVSPMLLRVGVLSEDPNPLRWWMDNCGLTMGGSALSRYWDELTGWSWDGQRRVLQVRGLTGNRLLQITGLARPEPVTSRGDDRVSLEYPAVLIVFAEAAVALFRSLGMQDVAAYGRTEQGYQALVGVWLAEAQRRRRLYPAGYPSQPYPGAI